MTPHPHLFPIEVWCTMAQPDDPRCHISWDPEKLPDSFMYYLLKQINKFAVPVCEHSDRHFSFSIGSVDMDETVAHYQREASQALKLSRCACSGIASSGHDI